MRGFTACPFFVWGFPGLRSCIDLAVGFKGGSGIPLSWLRSRRYTRFIFAGPYPGIGSLAYVVNVSPPPIGRPPYVAATRAAFAARATAQMKPANSRATAVMATVLSLPLLTSAR